MTADILSDPTHPHGTTDGYTRGCRGSHCPAPMACRTVHTRYQGDFAFRKAIDSGLSPEDILHQEQEAARAAKAAERSRSRATTPERRERPTREKRTAAPREIRRVSRDGKPTTELQKAVKHLNGEGLTDAEIGERIGKTRTQVSAVRQYLMLPARARTRTDALLRELHGEGLNDYEIAARLKKNPKYIGARRRRQGLKVNLNRTPAPAGVSSS